MPRLISVLQILSRASEIQLTRLFMNKHTISWYANIWADQRLYYAYGRTRSNALYRLLRNIWNDIDDKHDGDDASVH